MNAEVDRLVDDAIALRRAGNLEPSAQRFLQALALAPQHPRALTSYAMLLLDANDVEGALQVALRAVAADPGRMSAHHVLGRAQCLAGRFDEGLAALRRAVSLEPDAFDVHLDIGNALLKGDDLPAAEWHLERARELAPSLAHPLIMLGNLYRRQQKVDAAVASYRRAIEIDGRIPQSYNNLGTLLAEAGDGEGAAAALRRALDLAPNRASTWSNLLLTLNWSDRISASELAAEHFRFGRQLGGLIHRLGLVARPPLRGRRLKIGYVSSDFCSHAVALFVLPLLSHHDRERFEIHAFHNFHSTDEVTVRIEALVEHFVRVSRWSDNELVREIRARQIDILVDLNGHTAGNRLPVFLMKPAPIQVTWLGYLGTTGLATMDYRLSDERADPPGVTDGFHTEKLSRLPDTAWCYEPYAFAPEVGPLPAQHDGRVTFGSLNNPGKVSASVLALWARILGALPDARLMMVESPLGERVAEIDRQLASFGIAPERVDRLAKLATPDYLATYNRIDIALDTWPSAGGTTTCDALWMGVPVLTLAGERSFSRTGASMLSCIGMHEWVAASPEAYVAKAVARAQDVAGLQALRAAMRGRMRNSPLVDGARFARAVEQAFVAMARHAFGD